MNDPKELAHNIVKEATDASAARTAKIKEIARKLNVEYSKAESMVKQEETRKAASKKYRESDAYKLKLEQQKVVRAMLKS